jgi:hypothetical protein
MRAELMAVAALASGGAAALGVSACGSSSSSNKSASSAVVSTPTAITTGPAAPPKPTTIKVTVSGATVTIRLATLGFNYCRANPRTCAAVKTSQLKYLTQNQRNAVKAAQKKVKADEAAANQPAPAPAPAPQPAPAPAPPPSSGGGTTTG